MLSGGEGNQSVVLLTVTDLACFCVVPIDGRYHAFLVSDYGTLQLYDISTLLVSFQLSSY